MKPTNNIQAFPKIESGYSNGTGDIHFETQSGMTLLDHFAGLAMASVILIDGEGSADSWAAAAYNAAHEMLEARKNYIK